MSARARCALVALIGILAVFAWTSAKVHYTCDGNWTAVFCTGTNHPVPPDLRDTTYLFPGDGYDGQFYRYLAHDLFQQKGYSHYIDSPRYRGRRVLISALAWVLAFGKTKWVDASYIAVEMFFFGLGIYWTARILQSRGHSPYWGLLFLVVPGTLATIDRMLVDGPMTALFAGFIWYLEQKRWGVVWLLCAAALLTRDTGFFLTVAVVLDRLLHRDWQRAAWFCCTVIPVLAWSYFLSLRVPPETPTALTKLLGIPVWGLIERMFALRDNKNPFYQLILRVTDILSILGLGASVVLALLWIRKQALAPVNMCIAFFCVTAVTLVSPYYLSEAIGFGRAISPLFLWVMIEAVTRRKRAALIPPLLVSLSVSLAFAGPAIRMVQLIVR